MEERERGEKADAAFEAAKASCAARAKANEFKGNLPRIECYSVATLTWWEARQNDDVDLVRLKNAKLSGCSR